MSTLTATWSLDDDYLFGTLDIEVQSEGFTGHSRAWFDKAQLKETFITALRGYPLDPSSPPVLSGPYLTSAEAPASLRIEVTPYDRRGTLLVRVDLASWGHGYRPSNLVQTLTARFMTEYGMLARFADDLEALLDGTTDAATLRSKDP